MHVLKSIIQSQTFVTFCHDCASSMGVNWLAQVNQLLAVFCSCNMALTSKERMRKCREKLKENDEKREAAKKKDRERKAREREARKAAYTLEDRQEVKKTERECKRAYQEKQILHLRVKQELLAVMGQLPSVTHRAWGRQ